MNIATAFAESAQQNFAKTAVFWDNEEYSYQQLLVSSHRMAQRLQRDFAVRSGDRVGIWLKNCPEYFPALFGALEIGAIVVPINHFLKPPEVTFILEDGGIDVLITDSAFSDGWAFLKAARPGLRTVVTESISESGISSGELSSLFPLPHERVSNRPSCEISDAGDQNTVHSEKQPSGLAIPALPDESSLALIIYTSGTTGRPKGAMLTHGNLLHNVRSCRQVLSVVDYDRFVLLLPMFHSFMLCVCIMLPLMAGGSVVLIKSLNTPKTVIQEIMAKQATILPAIPQFFRALVDPSIPSELPLRLCISGAAPLPVQVLRDFNRKFTVPLLEGYGLSEASPVVALNPVLGPWKSGSIGQPIPDVEVRVRDEAGQWLSPGEIGEICVRGGNVMKGYWNQPEATAEALRDGWLLTGDVGQSDKDGYFYITDRKKDMLLVNGINVYPREIEEVIYQFNGIKEAAVVGQPDLRKGEQPVAFVAAMEGMKLDEKGLIQFMRERLADYKIPRKIVVLPALPRNVTGKILKTVLRGQIREGGFPS